MKTFKILLLLVGLAFSVLAFAESKPDQGVAVQAMTFFAVISDNGKQRIINSRQHPDQFVDRGMAGVVMRQCNDRMIMRAPVDEAGNPVKDGDRQLFLLTTNEDEALAFRPIVVTSQMPVVAPRAPRAPRARAHA